jgi:hypothetical protein
MAEFLCDDTMAPLPSLSIAPTAALSQVGSAVFDASNTEVRLFHEFGVLDQVWWGGLAGGQANLLHCRARTLPKIRNPKAPAVFQTGSASFTPSQVR